MGALIYVGVYMCPVVYIFALSGPLYMLVYIWALLYIFLHYLGPYICWCLSGPCCIYFCIIWALIYVGVYLGPVVYIFALSGPLDMLVFIWALLYIFFALSGPLYMLVFIW